ncbi:MAG: hypothetical protein NTV51_23095 [Verrucomicrobia bacterium]|nr:hypothetical protein [Verrucomicrobiota bacterium]
MKLDPTLRKFLRFGLIGFGALAVMSAVVNMIAAWQLIEAAEEQSLGITRGEFVAAYGVILLVGVAMVVAGLCWRK